MDEFGDQRLTDMLNRLQLDDAATADRTMALVYPELVRIAQSVSRGEPTRNRDLAALDPVGLVSETYLKIIRKNAPTFRNRRHFFNLAARAMQQVLIDEARRQAADKRGGKGPDPVSLEDAVAVSADDPTVDAVSLSRAVDKIATRYPIGAEALRLRFYVGLTARETAEAMGLPEHQVALEWNQACSALVSEWR